jgi:hypothetical protein
MKTVLYNTTSNEVVAGPFEPQYLVDGKAGEIPRRYVELHLIETEPPEYNPLTQKLSSGWLVNLKNRRRTLVWTVTDKTGDELDEEETQENILMDSTINAHLMKKITQVLLENIPDEDAPEFTDLFLCFRYDFPYDKGDRVRFRNHLYKILKHHTSARGANPENDQVNYKILP